MLSASQLSRLFEEYPNIDSVVSAAHLLTYLGRALLHNRDLHGETVAQKFQQMIAENPGLHTLLRECYNVKDFASLLKSDLFCSLRTFRLPQTLQIEKFLEELRPAMLQVVRGERTSILRWRCQAAVNEPENAHIGCLQIPVLHPAGAPLLLLHCLGSFRDDVVLRERLNNIFIPGTHTFLVNTSGSGKTRLLFEGLCQHWGMYFTSRLDSSRLGSADLGGVYDSRFEFLANARVRLSGAWDTSSISHTQQNLEAARRAFGEPLLARLLVFKLFLTLMHENGATEEHKRRWLMVQISFSQCLSRRDGFVAIIEHLRQVDDAYIDDWIDELLPHVHTLCDLSSHKDSLFLAIDEINTTVDKHTGILSEDGGMHHYPLLKELLRSWRERTKEVNATLVIAGTELPKHFFDHRPGEWTSFHWCSDTGGFEDPDSHKRYVSAFLPPQYRESSSGKNLIRRMWHWLRGRHRATATVITLLLANGFHSSHRVLDDFVFNATTFQPTDGEIFAQQEPVFEKDMTADANGYRALNNTRLKQDLMLRITVQEVLLHYLITSEHPCHFDDSRVIAVTHTMGRFVDTDTQEIAMNEPLNITAAAQWFALEPNLLTDLSYLIDAGSRIPQRPHSIAPYIALYIAHALAANPLLSDIFTFPGRQPAWATQTVELVSVRRTKTPNPRSIARVVRATDMWKTSTPLATRAKSFEQDLSWIDHSTSTPFCIPSSPNSDLIFVLRLADKRLVWVVVHCRVLGDANELKTADLKDIMTRLLPQNMFRGTDVGLRDAFDETNPANADVLGRLKALPNRCTDAGPYSILRVVASFPAQAALSIVSRKDSIPIAVLNTTKLQEVIDSISSTDVTERLVSTAIGIRKPDVAPIASPPAKRQLQLEEPLSRNTRSRTSAAVKESAVPPTARHHNTRSVTIQEKELHARRPRRKK